MLKPLTAYLLAVVTVSALAETAAWWVEDLASIVWLFAAAVLFVAALGLVVWAIMRQRRSNHGVTTTVLVVLVSPLVFIAMQWAMDRSLGWAELLAHRSSYTRIVQTAGMGASPAPIGRATDGSDAYDRSMWRTAGDGTRFAFDLRQPGRVVFPFPTRSRETRDGIVYDPSSTEQSRLAAAPGALAEDRISFVPNDDWTVLSCAHMLGRFYRCRFAPS